MSIWEFVIEKIKENKELYLMVVVASSGSSPGKQGFKMAVCDDGETNGSVGGGIMEFELVNKCNKLISEGRKQKFIINQKHNKTSSESSGMICAGEQTIAFIPVSKNHIELISKITKAIKSGNSTSIRIDNEGIKLSDEGYKETIKYIINDDKSWMYYETLGLKHRLYIVGAGHVGYAVSRQFSLLDFEVILLDNRQQFPMFEKNTFVSSKNIIDYQNIDEIIDEDIRTYVLISTSNHSDDLLVLNKLIGKKLAYLGLLGSKSKVEKFKSELKDKDLSRLHAPVGINIYSITPEEIAVSIAAEIIMVKNQNT